MMFSFTVFSKQIFVKRSLLIALALIATSFYSVQYVESHSGGETGSTDKGGANSGCSCHCSTSNAGTTVTIATASTVFLPNTTYTFTIKVTNATETNGGCNVACDNGTLTAGADGLRKSGSELTHNGAKALPATWTFTYKTPASGNDIIYAVGNAVNGDGGNNGGNCTDKWNFATQFNITVQTQARGLTMSTALLDFGSRRVGTSTTLTAKVNSIGPDAALTITSSALTTGTSYSTTPNTANRVIAIGSAEPESVTFTPTARGNVVDGLTLNTDATAVADQTKIISLIGKGINGEFTGNATVAFDRVRVGTTKTIVYTVNNSGDDTLFLAQPQFIGAAFTLGTPLTSTAIPPNGSATVGIKFSPNAKQQFQGSMTFAALNSVTVPTIALTGTGAAPIVSVASTTMDLGLNLTGTSVPGTFVVTNSGDDSLHISSIVISQPTQKFFLTSSGGPIAVVAGGSTQLTYNYTSASEGSDNGTLTINSDDIANPSKQITLLARSGTPKLTVNTKDTVDFGNVRVGGTGSASISVMNSGSYDLGISFGSFTPVVFNATNVFPTIPPLQKVDENLQFSPVKEGPVTGMFVIQSTDSHNSFDTVYMKGVGVISALVIPSLIDFHQLNISKTVDTTIMLHNFGTASAKIFSYRLIDSSKGFLILDTVAHSIAPKDSVKIKLRFAPTQEIPYSATLNITTDDASPLVKILLHGTGIDSKLSTDINSIDFTTVDSDSSRSKKFILTNNGSAVATIQSVKITGATEFSSTTVNTPFTLKAGATKEISITFSPLAAGTFDGTYVITATEGSPITVSLHGKGHVNTVVGSVKNISDEFGISLQISPNPVSKASEISISSAKPTNVTFGLFDANGKLVLTIAGGFIESEVRYFPLSVSGLPSGEYFLTAQVNGVAVASSKILIVH